MKRFYVSDIQNSIGVVVGPGSYCQLTLSQDSTTGSSPVTRIPIIIPIDNTGSFSQNIWFSDELLPSGSLYNVKIVTVVPNLGAVYNQNIPITGASFNLAVWSPTP